MPALFAQPQAQADLAAASGCDSFFHSGGLADLWFIRRSDILLVTFDNLGSIGEYDPPQPWLQGRAAKAGFSILGVMASQRDWYRNEDAPRLLRELERAGFFKGFRRVVFTGASMGGFAALSLAPLVPGAEVLAFSPQSSLAPDLVPFEQRYPYAARRWDWQSEGRDAASAMAARARAFVVYDPFVAEDAAHLQRLSRARSEGPPLTAPPLITIRAPLMGHRAIRQLKALGLLQELIEAVGEGRFDPVAFAEALRARRQSLSWQRGLLAGAEARGHLRLGLRAARRLAAIDPENRFARRSARRLRGILRGGAAAEPAPGASGPAFEAASESAAGTAADTRIFITSPAPALPFTGEIAVLSQALVLPERDHDRPLASGVLDHEGNWQSLSEAWIRARRSSPAPVLSAADEVRDLPGLHLFGGHFRGHFGHFLVESTARLWALDHLAEPPDSILYLPYRGDVAGVERAMKGHRHFFDLLGIKTPLRCLDGVKRVERLILPELGFGWLARYAGSPAYRAFMQGRLRAAAPAAGGERLYISRARLNPQKGGILGERVIEENLARLGWEIFHPEKHPLTEQIARYKAARQILALDGSALHLAAYVMPEGGRVGMILRRSMANAADYQLQFRSFCGIEIDVINVIRRDWVAGETLRSDYRSVGEIDFSALFDRLKTLGYVPQNFQPDMPDAEGTRALLDAFEDRRGQAFRALQPGEAHPDDEG